jgi:hypothetical protein
VRWSLFRDTSGITRQYTTRFLEIRSSGTWQSAQEPVLGPSEGCEEGEIAGGEGVEAKRSNRGTRHSSWAGSAAALGWRPSQNTRCVQVFGAGYQSPQFTVFPPTLITQSKSSSPVRLIPKIRRYDSKITRSRSCGNHEHAQLLMGRGYLFRPRLRRDWVTSCGEQVQCLRTLRTLRTVLDFL